MDGWLREVERRPILSVLCSSLAFMLLETLLKVLPRPHAINRDPWKSFKWKNLSVSLVHSLLTGPWAIFCVFQYPLIVYDLNSSTPVSYLLVVVSTGYFIHDARDIMFSGYARESWEFLLHHIM
ncbi:calfacilitin, partial [Clarias magur]